MGFFLAIPVFLKLLHLFRLLFVNLFIVDHFRHGGAIQTNSGFTSCNNAMNSSLISFLVKSQSGKENVETLASLYFSAKCVDKFPWST